MDRFLSRTCVRQGILRWQCRQLIHQTSRVRIRGQHDDLLAAYLSGRPRGRRFKLLFLYDAGCAKNCYSPRDHEYDVLTCQSNNLPTDASPINRSTATMPPVALPNVRTKYPKAKSIYNLKDWANRAALFRWGISTGIAGVGGKILDLGPDQSTLPLAAYTTACVSLIFELNCLLYDQFVL